MIDPTSDFEQQFRLWTEAQYDALTEELLYSTDVPAPCPSGDLRDGPQRSAF